MRIGCVTVYGFGALFLPLFNLLMHLDSWYSLRTQWPQSLPE